MPAAAEANKDAVAMRNWEDYADPVFGLTRGAWEREVQQFGTEQSGSAPVVPEYRATIGTSRYTLPVTSHLYLHVHHRAIVSRCVTQGCVFAMDAPRVFPRKVLRAPCTADPPPIANSSIVSSTNSQIYYCFN